MLTKLPLKVSSFFPSPLLTHRPPANDVFDLWSDSLSLKPRVAYGKLFSDTTPYFPSLLRSGGSHVTVDNWRGSWEWKKSQQTWVNRCHILLGSKRSVNQLTGGADKYMAANCAQWRSRCHFLSNHVDWETLCYGLVRLCIPCVGYYGFIFFFLRRFTLCPSRLSLISPAPFDIMRKAPVIGTGPDI